MAFWWFHEAIKHGKKMSWQKKKTFSLRRLTLKTYWRRKRRRRGKCGMVFILTSPKKLIYYFYSWRVDCKRHANKYLTLFVLNGGDENKQKLSKKSDQKFALFWSLKHRNKWLMYIKYFYIHIKDHTYWLIIWVN